MVVGFAWYRPEQWQRVRDISSDVEALEDSHEEWLALAEKKVKELQSPGLRVEKVDIHSEQLILWCNERGLEQCPSAVKPCGREVEGSRSVCTAHITSRCS
ncbi:hypothetical protein BH18ACI4_BH18ACI4_01350 [soil metagenome]